MSTSDNIIARSAVIVELNISVWTAAKLDRSATDSVIANANAVNNAAQVRKNLMAGTTLRKEIADHAAGCRMWHNKATLPWADKGGRLLPTSMFLDYKAELNARRGQFNALVTEFLKEYPQLVSMARGHMGALFDATDYPSDVSDKFAFKAVFSPVPQSGHFIIDVQDKELEELRSEYDVNFKSRMAEAMREPWDRLHKLLTHMSDKMTDLPDGEGRKQYHETLTVNAVEMCKMLEHMNLDPTSDEGLQLDAARRALESTFSGIGIDAIREDAAVRAEVKAKVDALLKDHW